MKFTRHIGLTACAVLVLGGCDKLSDVGEKHNDTPPTASVVVLNQPFTTDAAGKATTRVRTGTEVFLSGKDSEGGEVPVLGYSWRTLTNGAVTQNLKLITRNNNTVSFTAPDVSRDTTLTFRLTVTDANNQIATQDVDVNVIAIPDGRHFLTYGFTTPRKLHLSAMTSRNVTPAELATASGRDVSFEVVVRQLVDYTTPGVDGPWLQVKSTTLPGKWQADYGARRDCDSTQELSNPGFDIEVPALDIDDILALVDPRDPAAEPNPALVDQFRTKLE